MAIISLINSRINQLLPAKHKSVLFVLILFLLLLLLKPEAQQNILGTQRALPTNYNYIQQLVSSKFHELTAPKHENEPTLSSQGVFVSSSNAKQPDEIDSRLFLEVQPGDNLSTLFKRAGLDAQAVYTLSNGSADSKVLSNLYPGFNLALEMNADNSVQSLEIFHNPLESDLFTLIENNQYDYKHISRAPEIKQISREVTINDSLFMAAQQGGISAALTMKLADIYGGVIDFIQDIRKGDSFNIIYEEKYHDGKFIEEGDILAAQFIVQGEVFTTVRYVDLAGDVNFYNADGESMRKAFLLNPVDFTRISSDFNLSRKHPILNTIRAHKGTDYAAPAGTPVVATADGKVIFSGRKGSFGKLIVIKHGEKFETKYAHLKDYARGIKEGAAVHQGQIIGYVGSTGGATGPHLHYEFLIDGVHRNSRTVHEQLPQSASIAKSELPRFEAQKNLFISQLSKSHSIPIANRETQQTPVTTAND
ncbi:MAG: peptidoglycan DD-metalloendopeptidase family protein [Pseudomonadota bacterium]